MAECKIFTSDINLPKYIIIVIKRHYGDLSYITRQMNCSGNTVVRYTIKLPGKGLVEIIPVMVGACPGAGTMIKERKPLLSHEMEIRGVPVQRKLVI